MKSGVVICDINGKMDKADILVPLEINGNKYVIYTLEKEKSLPKDLLHVGLYDNIEGNIVIIDVDENTILEVKNKLQMLLNNL